VSDIDKNPYIDERGRIWKYGEFLPLDFSPFAYNETNAQKYFPKTKAEALDQGLRWYEKEPSQYVITEKAGDLPDTIEATNEEIIKEVIECSICFKAYRFTSEEVNLMKQLKLPLPQQCFFCREKFRFTRTNSPKLYDGVCMCRKENHSNHAGQCEIEFKTTYAPERPEIVYCEQCYQQEVA